MVGPKNMHISNTKWTWHKVCVCMRVCVLTKEKDCEFQREQERGRDMVGGSEIGGDNDVSIFIKNKMF